MSRTYTIFVPDEEIGNDAGYSIAIDWCFKNLDHKNVYALNEDELYFIIENTDILNIINEENNSMLYIGENDWIITNDIKKSLKNRLTSILEEKPDEIRKIYQRVIDLLTVSIDTNKYIYFNF